MAFDRIEPPDFWSAATARLLYRLVCSWSTGTPPRFEDFFPSLAADSGPMDDNAIMAAFGLRGTG